MIYAYTGKTGSGKTWHMVHDAYEDWKAGIDIYSNTILYFEHFEPSRLEKLVSFITRRPIRRGRIFYFSDINEILEVNDGTVLFDEGQVLFNARLWESLPDEFQYKLQQHRKHKLDLRTTAQNMGTIDIMYRRLVQVWYHHEPIFVFGNHLIALYRYFDKDIDMLYNNIDDLKVDNLSRSFFFISRFRRVLYDTLYDIGFKRLKTIWLTFYDLKSKQHQEKVIITMKKWDLKTVRSAMYTFKLGLKPSK